MTVLVGIDIGSHKICTLIGEALPGGGARVLGMGHAPAEGIRRGEVVHVDDAAGAIAASVERAERVAGIKVEEALIGVTGIHIEGSENRSRIPLGRQPRPVEMRDLERVLEAAGAVPLAPGREVLHVLPRAFRLDESGPVISPLGMEGTSLEADVHIVTASASALANLRRCLSMAEVKPAGLVFSTLAAAESSLTQDERELGAFVVDLGASVTGLACYRGGAPIHTSVIPIGSRHMTNDLAVLLQTPLDQAERIKTTFGHALPELEEEEVPIDIVPFGEAERRTTSRHHVSEVLAARADELSSLLVEAIGRSELDDLLPAGAVLTGGGTELKGLPRRLHQAWDRPVRVGRSPQVLGLSDAAAGPGHSGATGLLLWQARAVTDASGLNLSAQTALDGSGMGRMLGWMKTAFLPNGDRDHLDR